MQLELKLIQSGILLWVITEVHVYMCRLYFSDRLRLTQTAQQVICPAFEKRCHVFRKVKNIISAHSLNYNFYLLQNKENSWTGTLAETDWILTLIMKFYHCMVEYLNCTKTCKRYNHIKQYDQIINILIQSRAVIQSGVKGLIVIAVLKLCACEDCLYICSLTRLVIYHSLKLQSVIYSIYLID